MANSFGALLRGVQVMLCLAEAGSPLTVTKLSEALRLPPSTTHRILKVLKSLNYVEQDKERRYRVGPSFLRSASTLIPLSTYHLALRHVQQKLVEDSGESSFYAAYLAGVGRLRFVATLQSHQAIRYVMRSDIDYSLLWGASGIALASVLPEMLVESIYLRERDSGEGHCSLPAWSGFVQILDQVRRQGYAVSDGQRMDGAHAIAAPVFARSDIVIGSIGLSMPLQRREAGLTAKHIGLIRTAACDLTRAAHAAFDYQNFEGLNLITTRT